MEVLYFSFGSDPAYPYGREDYVVAVGMDKKDCFNTYKEAHPNRPGSDAINCADYYTADEWVRIRNEYYCGVAPKEVLVSDSAYGRKPKTYDPVWFFVPEMGHIIYLQAGSGDNLLPEDIAEGCRGYLDYTVFYMENGRIEKDEEFSGEIMLTRPVKERYKCMADAIPDILFDAYNTIAVNVQILR